MLRATMGITVLDASTGEVICGANLRIVAPNYDEELVTCAGPNVNGKVFVYAGVEHSNYRVDASAPGYQPSSNTVQVEYDKDCGGPHTANVEFKLHPAST